MFVEFPDCREKYLKWDNKGPSLGLGSAAQLPPTAAATSSSLAETLSFTLAVNYRYSKRELPSIIAILFIVLQPCGQLHMNSLSFSDPYYVTYYFR